MWSGVDLFLCISGIVCTFFAVHTIKKSYEGVSHDRHIKDLGREFAKERDAREKSKNNFK